MVEHSLRKRKVGGSIPPGGSPFVFTRLLALRPIFYVLGTTAPHRSLPATMSSQCSRTPSRIHLLVPSIKKSVSDDVIVAPFSQAEALRTHPKQALHTALEPLSTFAEHLPIPFCLPAVLLQTFPFVELFPCLHSSFHQLARSLFRWSAQTLSQWIVRTHARPPDNRSVVPSV